MQGLRRHLAKVQGVRYPCTMCPREYARLDVLRQHIRDAHGTAVRQFNWSDALNYAKIFCLAVSASFKKFQCLQEYKRSLSTEVYFQCVVTTCKVKCDIFKSQLNTCTCISVLSNKSYFFRSLNLKWFLILGLKMVINTIAAIKPHIIEKHMLIFYHFEWIDIKFVSTQCFLLVQTFNLVHWLSLSMYL